ncbi:peptidylprolyl isomerase [Sphingobium aquiterrae]|uniref:peptidylprolyl isomerase n=1 Tax=Sphingobium aquiterrae TaxID=2038656 RepID=UPI00301A9AEC
MLSFFRRFLGHRIGAYIALAFLAMIGLAFAAGDIKGLGGGLGTVMSGGDTVAKVGGESLSTTELQSRTQRVFEQQRRANPGLQIGTFLEQGALPRVLDQLVAGLTVSAFADDQGMGVSKRMVDAQIAGIQAFQDASGKFNQDMFRQALAREGISEKALREDITRDLLAKQLLSPASLGVKLPNSLVLPYASLLLETRAGRIAAVPAMAFANVPDPTEAQLKDYYAKNADRFTVPEQRRLRYALIDIARFATAATPTEAEIAAAYAGNKAAYAAQESRSIDQLVLPTQAAAQSIAADVAKGTSLAAAAQQAGLAVASLKDLSREALAAQSNAAVADAAYKAAQGALAGPVKSPLGWHVLRVTAITRTPAQTLDQVRGKLGETLRATKEQQLLGDFTGKLEDQVAGGATFDEVTKDNGLTIATTPHLIATGQSVQEQNYKAPAEVAALLRPAFDMSEDDDAQLVPVEAGKRYALLAISDIVAAAPPPLDKVRQVIVAQYKLAEGDKQAKALAEKIRTAVAKGTPLDQAVAQAGVALPPVQKAGGRRADVMRGDQRPPAEIAMLFSMAPKSVKVLPISGGRGYFVIQLDGIQTGDAAKIPALVERVRSDLGNVVSGEIAEQFERSLETQLGVTRNASAVAKTQAELHRANGVAQ